MKTIDTSKFINRGKFSTKSLFVEYAYNPEDDPVYTLAREDDTEKGYHSLYQLYMKVGDPTEASFVEKYFFSLRHWETLCNCVWFKPHIKEWRKELNQALHSDLLHLLMQDAKNEDSKTSTTSAKYLLDNYFRESKKTTTKNTKTDPKEVLDKEERKSFLEDAERIGILGRIN